MGVEVKCKNRLSKKSFGKVTYLKDGEFPWHLTRDITFERHALLPFAVNGSTLVIFRSNANVIPTTALPAERERLH